MADIYLVCTADAYELPITECWTIAQTARFLGVTPGAIRLNLWRQRREGVRYRCGVRVRGKRPIPCYVDAVPYEDEDATQLELFYCPPTEIPAWHSAKRARKRPSAPETAIQLELF